MANDKYDGMEAPLVGQLPVVIEPEDQFTNRVGLMDEMEAGAPQPAPGNVLGGDGRRRLANELAGRACLVHIQT